MPSGTKKTDVAIVGGGILGLAHACLAARAGRRVTLFERDPAARGASVRNFGMIWPIGQPPGVLHDLALRSRQLWLSVLGEASLTCLPTGSLHAAYRADEEAVGREFAANSGYECEWLNASQTLERSHTLREQDLLGALWSPTEITVDAREVVRELPRFLRNGYGVQFCFNTVVHGVGSKFVMAADDEWRAETVIVTTGDDFQSLFPAHFSQFDLTRCKLQMLRTIPQPTGWALGPALAFGLSFRHYSSFDICPTLPALRARVARDRPELDRWGIHVMASQTAAGEVTLGDSHEYGLDVNVFDRALINRLILEYAQEYLRLPSMEIAEQWHGVYAKHPEHAYIRFSPAPGVHALTVTTGAGMTLSFGLAEQTLREIL